MSDRPNEANSRESAPRSRPPPVLSPSSYRADSDDRPYLTYLEREIDDAIGREPKDVARAAVLIYDLCRVAGHTEEAAYLQEVFDRPALVLFQLSVLLRNVRRTPGGPPEGLLRDALVQVDDLLRFVRMSLDGETDPLLAPALVEFGDGIDTALRDGTTADLEACIDHLTNYVNDFFFDRLTARPALRSYVVGVELGISGTMERW